MYWKIGLVIIGIVLIVKGINENTLSNKTKDQPQRISCAKLAAEGPGDNAHIVLTDFVMAPNYVYESRGKSGSWSNAWVPALAIDSDWAKQVAERIKLTEKMPSVSAKMQADLLPKPTDIRVIISMPDAKNANDVEKAGDADTLQGVVVNTITKLEGDTERLLGQSYPGIDLGRAWIVEVGRRPKGAGTVVALVGGGLLAAAAGVLWFVVGIRQKRAAAAAAPPRRRPRGPQGEDEPGDQPEPRRSRYR